MEYETSGKRKGGRPKKEVLRDKFAGTWFTQEEYKIVKEKAYQAKLPISRFLQQAALQTSVAGRLSAEQNDSLNQLVGMARNLNQIAHKGNAEGFLSAIMEFSVYREKINNILNRLSP